MNLGRFFTAVAAAAMTFAFVAGAGAEDWKVKGKPWITLLRGKVLLNDGTLEQQPGSGKFISAGGPIPPIAGRVR